MTVVFTIIGLLAWRTGKMWGRAGLVIEGRGVRIAGLVILIIDLTPLFILLLMIVASALPLAEISHMLSTARILSMFFSVILNMLITSFCFMFGHHPKED
jgi:hypothetical protein